MFFKYFLPVCSLSFYSLWVAFAVWTFKILMKFKISIYFMNYAFCVVSKKSSLNPRLPRFALILFSRNCIILNYTFRLVNYFELISPRRCKVGVQTEFLVWGCPVVPAFFVKKNNFSSLKIAFAPLSKISSLYLCGSISGLSLLLHWSIAYPFTSAALSWLL